MQGIRDQERITEMALGRKKKEPVQKEMVTYQCPVCMKPFQAAESDEEGTCSSCGSRFLLKFLTPMEPEGDILLQPGMLFEEDETQDKTLVLDDMEGGDILAGMDPGLDVSLQLGAGQPEEGPEEAGEDGDYETVRSDLYPGMRRDTSGDYHQYDITDGDAGRKIAAILAPEAMKFRGTLDPEIQSNLVPFQARTAANWKHYGDVRFYAQSPERFVDVDSIFYKG